MEFLIIFLIVCVPLGIAGFIAGFSAQKDKRQGLSISGDGSA